MSRTVARAIIGAALATVLAACSQAHPPDRVEVAVPMPVKVYCSAPELEKPRLAIASLEPGSPPADTIRAYASTVATLKGAVRERDILLAGCRSGGSAAEGGK
jgi:hypothetical protein